MVAQKKMEVDIYSPWLAVLILFALRFWQKCSFRFIFHTLLVLFKTWFTYNWLFSLKISYAMPKLSQSYFIGVFCLIQAYAFIKYLRDHMSKAEFKHLFNLAIVGFAGLVFLAVIALTYMGTSSFYSIVRVSNEELCLKCFTFESYCCAYVQLRLSKVFVS